MKHLFLFIIAGFVSILLNSCNSDTKPEKENVGEQGESEAVEVIDEEKTKEEDGFVEFEFSVLMANMPTPLEEFVDLNTDVVRFNSRLMAPLDKAEKHASSSAIAVNCGIYMVDLTYQSVYHETNEMLMYLSTAHRLAEKVDADYAFNEVLSKDLERCMSNKDSLYSVMDRGYEAMEEYLSSEGRVETATQLLTGGWVETQHIMMQSLLQMKNPTEHLKTHIFGQRVHLANLLKLLSKFKREAGLEKEHAKLVKLQESFEKIHEESDVSHALLLELADELKSIRIDLIEM